MRTTGVLPIVWRSEGNGASGAGAGNRRVMGVVLAGDQWRRPGIARGSRVQGPRRPGPPRGSGGRSEGRPVSGKG
jgi:hypothetical protein